MALALDSVAPPAGPRAPPARAEGRSGRLRREPAPHRPGAQHVRTDISLTTYILASPHTQAPRRHPQHVRTDMSLTTYILTSPHTQAPSTSPAACPHGHVPHDMLASPRTQAPRRHPQHVRTDMSLTTCSRRRAPRPRDVTRSMSARTPGRPPRHCAYRGAMNVSQETCPSSDSAPRGPAAVRLSAQATVSSFSVNLGARGPAGGATESSARDIVGTTPDTTASATCLSVAPPAGHRAAPGYAGA